jgi:predicted secreted protein
MQTNISVINTVVIRINGLNNDNIKIIIIGKAKSIACPMFDIKFIHFVFNY